MSADNGIYIAKFGENDWRVKHAMAIENLDYYPKNTQEWKQMVKLYYEDAERFNTKGEALEHAVNLSHMIYSLEYGINILPEDYSEVFQ